MFPFPDMRARSLFAPPETPEQRMKRFLSGVNPAPQMPPASPEIQAPPKMPLPSMGPSAAAMPPSVAPKPQPQAAPEPPDEDEAGQYYRELERMRTNQGPALSEYQAALKQQPTQDQYKPSKMRRIGATIAGALGGYASGNAGHGLDIGRGIQDAPYINAQSEYANRIKGLAQSAALEEKSTSAQQKNLMDARQLGLKYAEFRNTQDKDKFDRGIRERGAVTAERQAGAAERRAATGEQEAGTHLIDVRNRGSAAALHAAEETARTNLMSRDTATREAAQKELAGYHKDSLELKGKQGKVASSSQQNYALDLAYRQLATDPRYKDFVKQGINGFFEVNPEKVNSESGVYDEFRRRAKRLAQDSITSGKLDYLDDEDEKSPWSATIKRER